MLVSMAHGQHLQVRFASGVSQSAARYSPCGLLVKFESSDNSICASDGRVRYDWHSRDNRVEAMSRFKSQ